MVQYIINQHQTLSGFQRNIGMRKVNPLATHITTIKPPVDTRLLSDQGDSEFN